MLTKAQIEKIRITLNQLDTIKNYAYTVFGTKVQEDLEPILQKIIPSLKPAKDKNEFPDFKNGREGIEIKSAVISSAVANDMGTINSYEKKLEQLDTINVMFIMYKKEKGTDERISKIYYGPIWEFIGLNRAGVLSYREKDGNLRPKNLKDFASEKIYVNTRKQFLDMLKVTNVYRSKRLVKKHSLLIGKTEDEINGYLDD